MGDATSNFGATGAERKFISSLARSRLKARALHATSSNLLVVGSTDRHVVRASTYATARSIRYEIETSRCTERVAILRLEDRRRFLAKALSRRRAKLERIFAADSTLLTAR